MFDEFCYVILFSVFLVGQYKNKGWLLDYGNYKGILIFFNDVCWRYIEQIDIFVFY